MYKIYFFDLSDKEARGAELSVEVWPEAGFFLGCLNTEGSYVSVDNSKESIIKLPLSIWVRVRRVDE